MTKAEERALEAYPTQDMYSSLLDGSNRLKREVFTKGYEQAEKDIGWHSVKDRQPYESNWYITCIEDFGHATSIGISFYDTNKQNWFDDNIGGEEENVDYWMEIPQLQK